jgi:aspartyl-tRNA(Asn)/glutamyl-tRNA(Gln) amidotransferase subunit B
MAEYTPTIGLEIHAELRTNTKMFCNSPNNPDAGEPNVNICPVCMGHPGTLPVINKEAVKHILKMGTAIDGHLADFTEFDRKNYFYPDLPKGYQISQYAYPLVSGGSLTGVPITRIHLEEDTARSQHPEAVGESASGDYSLVDYNRAGVPLMELVTEPAVRSGAQAVAFARELQLLLRYLGAGEANMEKGEMRVEANISVSDSEEFGTKVEVKNLNSFRSVERAIAYEIDRHIRLAKQGEQITQETRGWDEHNERTFSQRGKEEAHDYRYFPDPDLPKLAISRIPDLTPDSLAAEMPELPWQVRERYTETYGLKDEDAETFVNNPNLQQLFEEVAQQSDADSERIKLAVNYVLSDIAGTLKEQPDALERFRGAIAELIEMVHGGDISSRGAKNIIATIAAEGGSPRQIAENQGLYQQSDEGQLSGVVDQLIEENPQVVEDYRGGKESALQFLVGQGMKATKGSANPEVLKKLITDRIG